MTHEELNALVAAYAIDALSGDEHDAVAAHLETCVGCRAELDSYLAAVAHLTPDTTAPLHVWDRIAMEIAEPLSQSGEEPIAGPEALPTNGSGSVVDLESWRRARRWGWMASVAAVAALVLGGLAIFQQLAITDLTGPEAIALAAERAESEPGTFSADFEVDGVAVARVILTADGRGFVVPSDNLPALPSERAYQLWVINDQGAVISAGVLGHEPVASTFTWTGTVSGFALTREIAGGVVSSEGDVVSVITGA
jgi:anti-sigma-K factor RskA